MWSEADPAGSHGTLFADGLILQLASTLLRLRDARIDEASAFGGLAPWQVKRVTAYLTDNLKHDFSLIDVAAQIGLSPHHFSRAFKRATGRPPHRFLMERRVERARDMLSGTRLSLVEIALACGFAGQSHFTTAFKRHTGLTPGAWRAAVRH